MRLEPLPTGPGESSWAAPTSTIRRPNSTHPHSSTRNLAFDGILSRVLPLLDPGEETEHSVGVVFLASGKFTFRAVVEEVKGENTDNAEPKVRFSPLLQVDVSV